MSIDSELLKQALQLQKQVGREPWMDDISTIKAMRLKKVDWTIIYTLISQKHSLEMSEEVFEQRASSMLRSLSASATRKKKHRVSNSGASSEHRVSNAGASTEQHQKSESKTEFQNPEIDPDQTDFQALEKINPIA